jgi:hypothetical protein
MNHRPNLRWLLLLLPLTIAAGLFARNRSSSLRANLLLTGSDNEQAAVSQAVIELAKPPADPKPGPDSSRFVVTQAAPRLKRTGRTQTRPTGDYYSFKPQLARNTVLLSRVPPFRLHPSMTLIYPGPTFQNQADNQFFSRGFTHYAESAPNGRFVPGRGSQLMGGLYDNALVAANALPDNDPRKPWLLAWFAVGGDRNRHHFIDNEAAARYFGYYMYDSMQFDVVQPDGKRVRVTESYSPDFETGTPSPRSKNPFDTQWVNMVGWFCYGMADRAKELGQPVPMAIMYDWNWIGLNTLTAWDDVQVTDGSYPDPEPGMPRYLNRAFISGAFAGGTKAEPVGNQTNIANYLRAFGGAAGQAQYMRYTWDDATFFETNADGSYRRDEAGDLVYRTAMRDIRLYGSPTKTGPNEAFQYVEKIYERVQQLLNTNYYLSGGKHYWKTTDRQPGLEKIRRQFWFRFDTEYAAPPDATIDWNARPIDPTFGENDAIRMYVLADVIRGWAAPQPLLRGQGAPNAKGASQPLGVFELMTNGFYRASTELDWTKDNAWTIVNPRFWMKEQGTGERPNPDEHFAKKPIIIGGICPARTDQQNKPYAWLYWEYPTQEANERRAFSWWIDNGRQRTPAYRQVWVGRHASIESVQLPDWCATAEPKHVYFQFVDQLGHTQTWRGDYRQPRIRQHPTPPAP